MENMVNYSHLRLSYSGKKVFLTGHTGFKGAWLLKILNLLGARVKGYSLAPENTNDLFNLLDGDKLCDSVISDIRDGSKLKKEILAFQPDFIFHLAAQALVRESYKFPIDTFEINVMGTANLLECIRELDKKCSLVLVTTDKVYYNNEWNFPYREIDRLGGFDPYSASKACTELLIESYRNSFFNLKEVKNHLKGIAVARAGNVIGGGDWAKDRLFPDIIRYFSLNNPVIVRNPRAIRPWQHVLEPLFGYLLLGKNLDDHPCEFSHAYNFGPENSYALSVEEILKLSISIWGSGEYQIEQVLNQPHEAGNLKLDISKANVELGWRPKLSSEAAVKLTLDWYKSYLHNPQKISDITEEQILTYIYPVS
jgi:CDP-glucose 4,6-dehydratase